jgi:hypothetical protein
MKVMRWSSSLLGFLAGLVYAAIYLGLAFGAAGAGHGTGIFFAAILPYGLGLLFFPMIGFLAGDLRSFLSKVLFVSLMMIHYAFVINFLRWDWISEPAYVEKIWNYSPLSIILPAGFYLVGQFAIWAVFIRKTVMRGAPPNKALQLTAR